MTLNDIEIGSKWERIKVHGVGKVGEIITIEKVDHYIHYSGGRNLCLGDFLKRFRPLAKSKKLNFAFYKKSGKNWSYEDLEKIAAYCGTKTPDKGKARNVYERKYCFYYDDSWGTYEAFAPQDIDGKTEMAFEDIPTEPTERVEEAQPKAFYKESGEPWTVDELIKLSTYLGVRTISPSDYKLDRKYIYNDDNNGYFPWGLQHPQKVEGVYDRISYESIFPESKDVWLTSLDLATAPDTIAIAGNLYETNACSVAASDFYVADSDSCSTFAANNTSNQTQGNTMNPTNVKIEVNGKVIDLCPEAKAAKVKTDLEARKKYTVVVFNVNGSYSETLYFNAKNEDKAIAKMTKILQNPANIGKTATLHREIEILTTEIPVVKADV